MSVGKFPAPHRRNLHMNVTSSPPDPVLIDRSEEVLSDQIDNCIHTVEDATNLITKSEHEINFEDTANISHKSFLNYDDKFGSAPGKEIQQ
jgi:hypothetical protein